MRAQELSAPHFAPQFLYSGLFHAFGCHVVIEAEDSIDEYFAHDSPIVYSDVGLTAPTAARSAVRWMLLLGVTYIAATENENR